MLFFGYVLQTASGEQKQSKIYDLCIILNCLTGSHL